jgi:hypothetical protein
MFLFSIINISTRFILKKYYRTTARHFASQEYIKDVKNIPRIDYLIIGDSTGMHSIIPKLISNNTYSICISGSSLLDTYQTLSEFDISRINKGIILTNSFNSELHYGDDFWRRFILTNTYSLNELVKIFNESKNQNTFPANQFIFIEFYSASIATKLLLNKYTLEALSAYIKSLHWNVNYYQKYLHFFHENNGHISLDDPGSKFKLDDDEFFKPYYNFYNKQFSISATDLYFLNKIYKYIGQKNIQLIMPFLPLADQATKLDASIFKNSFNRYFQEYERNHHGFTYVPVNLELDRTEFFDFNHVNSKGAKKTTMGLLKLLNTHQ